MLLRPLRRPAVSGAGSVPDRLRAGHTRRAAALFCASLALAACTGPKPAAPVTVPPEGGGLPPSKETARPAEPWLRGMSAKPQSEVENLLIFFAWIKRLPAPDAAREVDIARGVCTRQKSDFNCLRYVLALDATDTPVDARVMDLLVPIQKNRNSPLQGLAQLIAAHDAELRRQDAQIEGLQKKLDALKSLEKSMSEKTGGGR